MKYTFAIFTILFSTIVCAHEDVDHRLTDTQIDNINKTCASLVDYAPDVIKQRKRGVSEQELNHDTLDSMVKQNTKNSTVAVSGFIIIKSVHDSIYGMTKKQMNDPYYVEKQVFQTCFDKMTMIVVGK